MIEWVLAVERAYVGAATGGGRGSPSALPTSPASVARARAAASAVASRYLAVGSPRSMGFIVERDLEEAGLALAAHRMWFAPRDLRCAAVAPDVATELAAVLGGRAVSVAEAMAADIVCVHGPATEIRTAQLRRGSHVNVFGDGHRIEEELRRLAREADEPHDLPALAAGLVDGRQLDELTVFVTGEASIGRAALAALP